MQVISRLSLTDCKAPKCNAPPDVHELDGQVHQTVLRHTIH